MNVDEQHVAVLVDQLDRLVGLAVLGDLHQSVEAPHAVIDVHHVVARFEPVELGDGHLLVAADLAVDAVALVAVEDLVVGIEAQPQVVVDEPLVQRRRQRPHGGPAAADLVEDMLQTLRLRLVFREDPGRIAALRIADHVVGQQLEILVEGRLRRRREEHLGRRRTLLQVVAQRQQAHSGQVGQQDVAADDVLVDPLRLLHVAQQLAAHLVHAAQRMVRIDEPPGRILPGETRQRDLRGGSGPRVEVRNDLDPVEPFGRQLARDLESPDRIHLVAEEIDAVGFALRVGEDVDDAAAHRILPRFVDEVDPHEPRIGQALLQHGDRDRIAHPHRDRFALQLGRVGNPLGQRLGIGADDRIVPLRRAQGTQCRRTLHHALRIFGPVGRRTLVGGRKKVYAPFVEQVVEVVQQIGRGIAVVRHEHVQPPDAPDRGGGIERESPAGQLFQMDGGLLSFVFAAQQAELFRRIGELRQLFLSGHLQIQKEMRRPAACARSRACRRRRLSERLPACGPRAAAPQPPGRIGHAVRPGRSARTAPRHALIRSLSLRSW